MMTPRRPTQSFFSSLRNCIKSDSQLYGCLSVHVAYIVIWDIGFEAAADLSAAAHSLYGGFRKKILGQS